MDCLLLFEISLFIKILLILGTALCVKINQLIVPDLASPTKTATILDCDYSLEFPKDEGLVVKWFFNERMYPVYQWIPDAKPQELGILKGRLDLGYRASEDKHQIHRALKIVKLSPELAGNYTCSVSTFSSEDSQTKSMLVFVPEKLMELKYPPMWYRTESDSKVLCYVEDIFPKPEMKLFINGSEIENATVKYQERNSALFDVEIFAFVPNLVDGTSILCQLHVTIANYTVRKEAIYYEAFTSSNSPTPTKNYVTEFVLIMTLLHHIF